jgi:hypothetical protein
MYLAELKRQREAHQAVKHAISLAPEDDFGYAVQGYVFLIEQKWAEAERSAREALVHDADSAFAQNVLTQALLFQGKKNESRDDIKARLSRDPNDAFSHLSAGLHALRSGEQKKAETHLLEALRLDPSLDVARETLLEAYRARSWFYRTWLRINFKMAQFSSKYRVALFLGLYVLYQVFRRFVSSYSPALGSLVGALWLMFVLWSFFARGLGTLLILKDKVARYSLRAREKWEGIIVGGGFVLGLLLLSVAFMLQNNSLMIAGGAMIFMTLPFSLWLGNANETGRKFYAVLSFLVLGCVLVTLLTIVFRLPVRVMTSVMTAGALICIACTWLGMFRIKYE